MKITRYTQMDLVLKCITWNVDMQGDAFRWKALINQIKELSPDIIFIQEATIDFLIHIKDLSKEYQFFGDNSEAYFVFLGIKKSSTRITKGWHRPFPNSRMGRKICCVQVIWNNIPINVITSHLESEKPNSNERKSQFLDLINEIQSLDYPTIFAGDTNLRIKEVTESGGLPNGIYDFWEQVGKPEVCKDTWDVHRKPITMDVMRFARGRYDRIFFKSSEALKLVPKLLKPLGKDEIAPGIWASDHLGLYFEFKVN